MEALPSATHREHVAELFIHGVEKTDETGPPLSPNLTVSASINAHAKPL
jgi:hypothetical protein